jgi:hypothetical protein
MSSHQNLLFFNKEGDNLNFNYNNISERFEGNILFHENSTDTFKTYGLYLLEKVPSFEFERPGELTLEKFQLFNEFGLHLYGAKFEKEQIDKIESVNNDSKFYSKLIYGENFESKFPIGTIIIFDSSILEFNNPNKTYTVVATRKNAIMVISTMDNSTFEINYGQSVNDPLIYEGKTISGINTVGVYNYIDNTYQNNLSNWNEPNFYDKYYDNKKLNIINSEKNDGVVTIINSEITDTIHYEYSAKNIPSDKKLIIEVLTKTDLPIVYEGGLSITGDKIFLESKIPEILFKGMEFKIVGSSDNTNFISSKSIPTFEGNNKLTFYATQSQVIYNNKVYECIQAHTFSGTSSITPDDQKFWGKPTHISVSNTTIPESLLNCQIYLTSDRYYFEYEWNESSSITLASAAEKYKNDLLLFNIDLYYKNGKIRADLIYPSKYAEVNFYHTSVSSLNSFGDLLQTNEKMVRVRENLNYELNYNLSSNFNYNIVFTDIDEFGIKLVINKMVYEEEVAWIFTGAIIDMPRTIDRTLRNWLTRNYTTLYTLGITTELDYIGSFNSIFFNTIKIKTQYPNIPIEINRVEVGTTADFYIEHSRVVFTDLGGYLSIKINGKNYDQEVMFTSPQIPNIPATLSAWTERHLLTLNSLQIFVTNINNLLKFDLKDANRRLDYSINIGKSLLPGQNAFNIIKRLRGNHGMLLTSNEVKLPKTSDSSFEEVGFATGMVFSINNTIYPFNNQEYNILLVEPDSLNLSYQGPFWGLTDSICNSSAYITLAFNLGFGQTACEKPIDPNELGGGPFDPNMFDMNMFSLTNNQNTYQVNTYNFNNFQGTTNLVDLIHVQISNTIYALGDSLIAIDAYLSEYITSIDLPNSTNKICLKHNPINNYLYCLSENIIHIVDPILNEIVFTISLNNTAFDIEFNTINGDVFVTYSDTAKIDLFNLNNALIKTLLTTSTSDTMTGKMAFNEFEGDMYITSDGVTDNLIRVNGNTRQIKRTYGISGLKHTIYYEPVNESIYIFGNNNLFKIDNDNIIPIESVSSESFNDILFNNISGQMNISNSSTNFHRLDLNSNESSSLGIGNYGFLNINQFDGDIYLSSQSLNSIVVIDSINGNVKFTESMEAPTKKLIYNPSKKSIWSIQPSINSIIEVEVTVNSSINILNKKVIKIEDGQLGTLSPEYIQRKDLWLKTRDYARRPRERFEGDNPVYYYFRWFSDNIPQFFMYDFSGEQLSNSGVYAYKGPKPLDKISLNRNPNKDISKVEMSEYQQTIFNKVEYKLQFVDDSNDISTDTEAIQLFLGFKSDQEGSLRSMLQLFKKEDLKFNIISNNLTEIIFETIIDDKTFEKTGMVSISENSPDTFTNRGLRIGQHISFFIKDLTNKRNQYISKNNGLVVKIKEIFTKFLVVDFLNSEFDSFEKESTVVINYPKDGDITYLRTSIEVIDKEIGRFVTYAQTEEEDVRFKVELSNIGKNIGPNETFIFKDYDIKEGGIDWTFLNKKRKEMLMLKHLIYPYIGSYKSIINAINFFGYNDLSLNEYYRNIEIGSENYFKLFKIEIPDIFDNTVEGWKENDWIKNIFPNEKYEETNLLNLSYDITDKEGNNILSYTLDEVIIKLQGLKYWLTKNIIPLTHKILDITGRAYIRTGTQIQHRVHDMTIINLKQTLTPISFKLTEAYLLPINTGSTVYNLVLEFNSGNEKYRPDSYTINIKTYKTYKEWIPFSTYNKGDKVTYFERAYESIINKNKVKNPRKYEDAPKWVKDKEYFTANIVEYERDYFIFSGSGISKIAPLFDTTNWKKITEWKLIDFEPVQRLTEFREIDNLLPYNFTIDSNIDPFIIVEVTSDNGYGAIYKDIKNYEIRGLKDLDALPVNRLKNYPVIPKPLPPPTCVCIPIIQTIPGIQAQGNLNEFCSPFLLDDNNNYYLIIGDVIIDMKSTPYIDAYNSAVNDGNCYMLGIANILNILGYQTEFNDGIEPNGILKVYGKNYAEDNGLKISWLFGQEGSSEITSAPEHFEAGEDGDIINGEYYMWTMLELQGGIDPVEGNENTLQGESCEVEGIVNVSVTKAVFNMIKPEHNGDGYYESSYIWLKDFNGDTYLYLDNVFLPISNTDWLLHLDEIIEFINSNTQSHNFTISREGTIMTLVYSGNEILNNVLVEHTGMGRASSLITFNTTTEETIGLVLGKKVCY